MPRLVPFKNMHLFQIETDFEFSDANRTQIVHHEECLTAFSLLDDNTVMACGGVYRLWEGVGEVWMVLSKDARKMPITVSRCTLAAFETIMENNDLWRVQASVHANDEKAYRFADWCGFEEEGLMRMFGPDKSDYYRFARVV
jgi:RimJ/RimL family protein N-acetyltransferase